MKFANRQPAVYQTDIPGIQTGWRSTCMRPPQTIPSSEAVSVVMFTSMILSMGGMSSCIMCRACAVTYISAQPPPIVAVQEPSFRMSIFVPILREQSRVCQ